MRDIKRMTRIRCSCEEVLAFELRCVRRWGRKVGLEALKLASYQKGTLTTVDLHTGQASNFPFPFSLFPQYGNE